MSNDIITVDNSLVDAEDPSERISSPKRKFPKLILAERTVCRLIAVQSLYAMEISGKRPSDVIEDLPFVQNSVYSVLKNKNKNKNVSFPNHINHDYTASIIRGVVREQRVIDPLIADTLLGNWQFSRVDKVVIAILRCGIYELLFSPDIPPKVIINEYTNISSSFELSQNNSLVNGVLDAISRENNLIS